METLCSKKLRRETQIWDREAVSEAMTMAIEALKEQPEIIHCKDCKWWSRKGDSPIGYCYAIRHSYYSRRWEVNIYRTYEEDFYCADAELRTGEKEEEEWLKQD